MVTAQRLDKQLQHLKPGVWPEGHKTCPRNLGQVQDHVEGNVTVHNIGLLQEARGQNHSYGFYIKKDNCR